MKDGEQQSKMAAYRFFRSAFPLESWLSRHGGWNDQTYKMYFVALFGAGFASPCLTAEGTVICCAARVTETSVKEEVRHGVWAADNKGRRGSAASGP